MDNGAAIDHKRHDKTCFVALADMVHDESTGTFSPSAEQRSRHVQLAGQLKPRRQPRRRKPRQARSASWQRSPRRAALTECIGVGAREACSLVYYISDEGPTSPLVISFVCQLVIVKGHRVTLVAVVGAWAV